MAENKGFFRRLFTFGAKEEDRSPQAGDLARAQDTSPARPDAAAPEIQPPAVWADTDGQGRAATAEPPGGGIAPLAPHQDDALGVEAEKKTP
jgi:hypothetical protein